MLAVKVLIVFCGGVTAMSAKRQGETIIGGGWKIAVDGLAQKLSYIINTNLEICKAILSN
ncbi:MAG: hypothetical protein ACJAT7_001988 [Psychromonas sp.]